MLQFCASAPCNLANPREDGTFDFPRTYFKRITDSSALGCEDSKIEKFQAPGNAGVDAAQTTQDMAEIKISTKLPLSWHLDVSDACGCIWMFQSYVLFKTRCSPRTRMLTRMLMLHMSKHMDITLFCNTLFEQSCTYFPCYQSAVWSGKCRVWTVEWEV